jgi:hypothetical protein
MDRLSRPAQAGALHVVLNVALRNEYIEFSVVDKFLVRAIKNSWHTMDA